MPDLFAEERRLLARGSCRIAGVDEAGRGPLAGPVVAAAVMFDRDRIVNGLPDSLEGLNDSKQLLPAVRDAFYAALVGLRGVSWAIAQVGSAEVDTLNILRATHAAMRQALAQLDPTPEHVLVDGLPVPGLPAPHTALVKGDARSYSIAAASVLAKVTRDRLMIEYDACYPGYGFARHKGYGTPEHLEALARLGPCPIHRRSFAPLRPVQGELF